MFGFSFSKSSTPKQAAGSSAQTLTPVREGHSPETSVSRASVDSSSSSYSSIPSPPDRRRRLFDSIVSIPSQLSQDGNSPRGRRSIEAHRLDGERSLLNSTVSLTSQFADDASAAPSQGKLVAHKLFDLDGEKDGAKTLLDSNVSLDVGRGWDPTFQAQQVLSSEDIQQIHLEAAIADKLPLKDYWVTSSVSDLLACSINHPEQTLTVSVLHNSPVIGSDRESFVKRGNDSQWLQLSLKNGKFQLPKCLDALGPRFRRDGDSAITQLHWLSKRLGFDLSNDHHAVEFHVSINPPQPLACALPGPPKKTLLDAQAIQRIGCAPLESDQPSQQWPRMGWSMHAKSRVLGTQIARGEVPTFRTLWLLAREWRNDTPSRQAQSQSLRSGPLQTPIISEVLTQATRHVRPLNRVGKALQVMKALRTGVDPAADSTPELVSTAQYPLNGHTVDLTQLSAIANYDDITKSEPVEVLVKQFTHAPADCIEPLLDECQLRYELLMRPQDKVALLSALAEIHWLVLNAMPDQNGNREKAELCIRAIAAAHGVELPPFENDPYHRAFVPLGGFEANTAIEAFTAKYGFFFGDNPALAPASKSNFTAPLHSK